MSVKSQFLCHIRIKTFAILVLFNYLNFFVCVICALQGPDFPNNPKIAMGVQ